MTPSALPQGNVINYVDYPGILHWIVFIIYFICLPICHNEENPLFVETDKQIHHTDIHFSHIFPPPLSGMFLVMWRGMEMGNKGSDTMLWYGFCRQTQSEC